MSRWKWAGSADWQSTSPPRRNATVWLYHRAHHDPNDVAAVRRWEFAALIGTCAFAGLVGLAGAYSLIFHPNSNIEILTNCCVMGYIAGVSSRNERRLSSK